MVYQGSKNKISKYLKPIIESYLKDGMWYVEPFVGGANMINKIDWNNKYGYDNNKYLIALHKKAQETELPLLNTSREAYNIYRDKYNKAEINNSDDEYLIGYYGFLGSFNGRFYSGGYGAVDKHGKNMMLQRLNNLNNQAKNKNYKNIIFETKDFKDLKIKNSVIYLDPPYQNTKEYQNKFNHNELLEKCKEWADNNNIILLSELTASNEYWEEIWNMEHQYTLRDKNNANKKVVERLYIWKTKK